MRVRLLLAAVSGSGLIACTVPAPEPGPETTSAAATAVIVVERTSGPSETLRQDAVIARFVRVKQGTVDDPALRLAGINTDIPSPGLCLVPSEGVPVTQGRSVELLDVGQVTLTSTSANPSSDVPTRSTVLLPRTMPDPANLASGVLYSSRSTDVFSGGSRVALRAGGGADLVEGFSATATAPRDVTDVRVSSLWSGLDVTWDASEADAHDVVYVDVLSPSPRVVVRCAANDSGRLVVPQSMIAGVDEGQLAVHRLHREAFKAKGIEPGEVRFDVARIVTFRR